MELVSVGSFFEKAGSEKGDWNEMQLKEAVNSDQSFFGSRNIE